MPQELETPDLNNPTPVTPITPTIEPNQQELFQQVLRDAQAREAAAQQRIRDLEDRLNTTPTPIPTNNPAPVTDQQFWDSPAQNLQKMIGDQVKPLHDFIAIQQKRDNYNTFKAQYRQHAGFNQIEGFVDNWMNGKEITHANMQEAIRSAIGDLVLRGGLNQQPQAPAPTPQTPSNPPNNQPPVQAHLRPSINTPPVVNNDKPTRRALTENERRLIREWNMTEEEYFKGIEADPRVSTWEKKK